MKVEFTKDQQIAETLIYDWFFNSSDQCFVLAGYAGTGKTFLMSHVVAEKLKLKVGSEAVFVTPTGKAASVLIKSGVPAGTVHGLIYKRDEDDFDVDENGEIVEKEKLKFVKRDKIDEKIRLIVIDEASMVDEGVLCDLLSFGAKCLFCGDNAQLPPVNGDTKILERPSCQLREIVRQEEDNPIIMLSEMARQGKKIPYGNYGDAAMVISRANLTGEQRKRLLLEADEVICGRNKTRSELNEEIRGYLGFGGEKGFPTEGEKLICTLNDWEKPLDEEDKFHLVNGVIGRASHIWRGEDKLAMMEFQPDFTSEPIVVPFDTGIFEDGAYAHRYGDRAVLYQNGKLAHENNFAFAHKYRAESDEPICRFEYAYAVTCHKAQGSEFDFVIVFDESWVFSESRDKWLYTAITRAKKRLVLVR